MRSPAPKQHAKRYAPYMRTLFKILGILLLAFILIFYFYFNNTNLVDAKTVSFYNSLKDSLRSKGYSPKLLVISTKRFKFHNDILVKISGAASKSRHLVGDAIDFIVLDVNRDGKCNGQDVDIVYQILDRQIIKDQGGIGTYKTESSFFNRQMVHIDCRGYKARWK